MSKDYIYGIHPVEAAISQKQSKVIRLICLKHEDKRLQKIFELARKKNIIIDRVSVCELENLVGHVTHQGLAVEIQSSESQNEHDLYDLLESLTQDPFLLILDGVQDPHNLGACLRTADAAGVHAVIVPKDNAVGLTPVVCKVASGAAESMPFFQVTNLSRTMRDLKERGIWLFGAAEEASDNLFQANLKGPKAIVMGAEGSGLRRLTKENCDQLLYIPMQGSVESLNVSVATGVFLFEALRQSN